MADEKLTPLDQLANQADGISATVQAEANPQPAAPDEPQVTTAQALAGLLTGVREGASELMDLQSPRIVLTDDKIQKVAEAVAPALDKHGLSMVGGKIPVELHALFVAGPIMWATTKAVLAELASKQAKAQSEARLMTAPVVPMGVVADGIAGGPNG